MILLKVAMLIGNLHISLSYYFISPIIVHFHELSHTFATRMLEANVPAKVVQDVLGHADVTLTLNTYSHVIGSTAHEQMAKINGLFQTDDIVKQQPVKKPSIKQQLADGKKELQATEKKTPTKAKNKDEPKL